MNQASDWSLLQRVSRSFYLTLRVLPCRIRPQIGVAYLLARASDTIADTALVPVDDRLAALAMLQKRVLGKSTERVTFGRLSESQGSDAERLLLESIDRICGWLRGFDAADQERIRDVFAAITSGQELDLRRFGHADAAHVSALATDEDLEDYTYRVAGCVGEFWTRMCRAHVLASSRVDDTQLLADGVRFGKGLQMVNILRDLAVDLRIGRCYMPKERLKKLGLEPSDLLAPSNHSRIAPLYEEYLDRAEDHLRCGWRYTQSIPYACWRVRLACAWPILIGVRTLKKMRGSNPLDPAMRIKISRGEVRAVILKTVLLYPLPGTWRRLWNG